MNDNGKRDSPTCAPQVTSTSEKVFSITEGYTRQPECHQTGRRRTRSTTCALQGSFAALFRIYVSSEEQMWLRIIMSPY
ncbi:hypothetical protein DPMN_010247 [Dreissena polymorpha]|uniref:Uncharacterized protein n=1 Tax=Dreissena polymorpha TaxID=45954 RepID=A0A9D4S0T4_DREPO|nr:hypothetical protein DPMN_010247 [Dreissena polymorpha]